MLEILYTQIGLLEQLLDLDLRAEGMIFLSASSPRHYGNTSPWLMTLGEEGAG